MRKRGGGGRSQIVINVVDVLDPTRNFTGNERTSLGWNGGQDYVALERGRMNLRGCGIQGGGHGSGKGYEFRYGPRNVNSLNANKSVRHYEGQQGGQVQGQGSGAGHVSD